MLSYMWSTDGNIFLSFIKEHLAPQLRENQVVTIDNLSTHKLSGVREAIEVTGATVLFVVRLFIILLQRLFAV